MNSVFQEIVLDILSEEKTDRKERKRKKSVGIEASTGSGRFSAGVTEAGALASDDPGKLMDNLKITSAGGKDDIEKIESVLRQAFTGADAMKQVYTSLSRASSGGKSGLRVGISVIKMREGIKYLYHTLTGANNAGVLNLKTLVQIENAGDSIIIYSGKKNTWEKYEA